MYNMIIDFITNIVSGVNSNETMDLFEFVHWCTTRGMVIDNVQTFINCALAAVAIVGIVVITHKITKWSLENKENSKEKEEA